MDYEKIAKSALDAPFRAQQKWTELMELLKIVSAHKPENVLEIGVFKGGTINAWTHVALPKAKIVGIDLPGGKYGGGFLEVEGEEICQLAKNEQTIALYPADSHLKKTFNQIKKVMPLVDFLFIDADHTYEGAKTDFDLYSPLVKKGGVIALHDIVEHTNYHDVKVHILWQEVKEYYKDKDVKIHEFIDKDYPTDHGMWGGIGVIEL